MIMFLAVPVADKPLPERLGLFLCLVAVIVIGAALVGRR